MNIKNTEILRRNQIMVKAEELALAIEECNEFKSKDTSLMRALLFKCNQIINDTIKLNYGAICSPPKACSCGK